MGQLRGIPLRAEPALAGRRRQHDRTQVAIERRNRRPGGRGSLGEVGAHGCTGRVRGQRFGHRLGLLDEGADPGEVHERALGVEPADGPVPQRAEVRPGRLDDGRNASQARGGGREPDVERRERAGQQPEQAVAQEEDPAERVPGVLALGHVAVAFRGQDPEEAIAVDPGIGREVLVRDRGKAILPAIEVGQHRLAARLGQVGPPVVVLVDPRGRRREWIEAKRLIDVGADERVEIGQDDVLLQRCPQCTGAVRSTPVDRHRHGGRVPQPRTTDAMWRAFLAGEIEGIERRTLALKGREEPVDVVVLGAQAAA